MPPSVWFDHLVIKMADMVNRGTRHWPGYYAWPSKGMDVIDEINSMSRDSDANRIGWQKKEKGRKREKRGAIIVIERRREYFYLFFFFLFFSNLTSCRLLINNNQFHEWFIGKLFAEISYKGNFYSIKRIYFCTINMKYKKCIRESKRRN